MHEAVTVSRVRVAHLARCAIQLFRNHSLFLSRQLQHTQRSVTMGPRSQWAKESITLLRLVCV